MGEASKDRDGTDDWRNDAEHQAAVKLIEGHLGIDYQHELRLYLEARGGIKKGSKADRLTDYVFSRSEKLFFDITNDAFVQFKIGRNGTGPYGIYKVRSKEFKVMLSQILWQREMKSAGTESVNAVVNVVEAKARCEGKLHQLYNRVAPDSEGGIWYDLCNVDRETIHITKDGWKVDNNPPILFRRFNHQQPQDQPDRDNADATLFLSFLNIESEDEKELILIDMITKFIPEIPHPPLIIHGSQGSAKSTLMKLESLLVDPSSVPLLTLPRTDVDLILQLYQHWLAFYDNIGFLPDWVSDLFCSASTGIGSTKRELYTDDDAIIFTFRRCVGANGINVAGTKPDFLDRCILIKLTAISKEKRRQEKEIIQGFLKDRPRILAGIFNILSKTLRVFPTIKVDQLPRMADYVMWGCAIAEVVGLGRERFLQIYNDNIGRQVEEATESSVVARVLLEMLDDVNGEWNGSPSELLQILAARAEDGKINIKDKQWPKAPHILTRRLKELEVNLMALGYYCDFSIKGHARSRSIKVSRSPFPKTVQTSIQNDLKSHLSMPAKPAGPEIATPVDQKIAIAVPIADECRREADLQPAIAEIATLHTLTPLSSGDEALLARLEKYMEREKSVGVSTAAKDLGVEEITLASLGARSSKITWSEHGVLDWHPDSKIAEGEKVECICPNCNSTVTTWPSKDQILLTSSCLKCGDRVTLAKLKVKCTVPTCGATYTDWFPDKVAINNQRCALCKTTGFLEVVRDERGSEDHD